MLTKVSPNWASWLTNLERSALSVLAVMPAMKA
jgi:hypothetical protein